MLLHFVKRILEVQFIHDFSGSPTEEMPTCVAIGGFYAFVAWVFVRT